MPIHDLDLARIHIADLMAEADRERMARLARQDGAPRFAVTRPGARAAIFVAVAIVVAIRALPATF
jgi:hypothetical protein